MLVTELGCWLQRYRPFDEMRYQRSDMLIEESVIETVLNQLFSIYNMN